MKLFPKKRQGPFMSPKQVLILKALVKRNPDGTLLDIQQLMEAAAPGRSRGAMICSLRHLATHGLIIEEAFETRRKRRMRTYAVTQAGMNMIRPGNVNPVVHQKVVTP